MTYHSQARLSVPSPRALLAVIDRMRSLGAKAVRCDAHAGTGELVLSASSDCVALKATFRGQVVDPGPLADGEGESWQQQGCRVGAPPTSTAPPHFLRAEPIHADVHVSIRDFSRTLKAISAVPLSLLMCACQWGVLRAACPVHCCLCCCSLLLRHQPDVCSPAARSCG